MKKLTYILALATAALNAAPALADGPDRLSFGVGYYDIFDDEDAVDVRAEYRFGNDILLGIKPFLGAEATTDAALYGLGGLYGDIPLAPQWYLTPSVGAGLYLDGSGKDLGSAFEIRSQVEVGYEFSGENRVSVGLSNISNAGVGDHNPGTQVLNVYYHMPIQ